LKQRHPTQTPFVAHHGLVGCFPVLSQKIASLP
jgi:hypothetical protein